MTDTYCNINIEFIQLAGRFKGIKTTATSFFGIAQPLTLLPTKYYDDLVSMMQNFIIYNLQYLDTDNIFSKGAYTFALGLNNIRIQKLLDMWIKYLCASKLLKPCIARKLLRREIQIRINKKKYDQLVLQIKYMPYNNIYNMIEQDFYKKIL